jgi:hypothetical protein
MQAQQALRLVRCLACNCATVRVFPWSGLRWLLELVHAVERGRNETRRGTSGRSTGGLEGRGTRHEAQGAIG